jgi:hypothetical protein
MKSYIIQIRITHDGDLQMLWHFDAPNEISAIANAATHLKRSGQNAVEIIATENN